MPVGPIQPSEPFRVEPTGAKASEPQDPVKRAEDLKIYLSAMAKFYSYLSRDKEMEKNCLSLIESIQTIEDDLQNGRITPETAEQELKDVQKRDEFPSINRVDIGFFTWALENFVPPISISEEARKEIASIYADMSDGKITPDQAFDKLIKIYHKYVNQ